MLAYLVIREGSKWSDVIKLVSGRTVTIGRAPTNSIVVKDERCSRNHAEVFLTKDQWTLRDLDSRNGTVVDGIAVKGDYPLQPGDIIRVANTQLAFVHDLTDAFAEAAGGGPKGEAGSLEDDTIFGTPSVSLSDSNVLEVNPDKATITARRQQTRFLEPTAADDSASVPKVGRAAQKLCQLAFELANQPDIASVSHLALNGLLENANVDAGAVLLVPKKSKGPFNVDELELIASRSDREPRYHRMSTFLGETVLREGEAVLARNIEDDSQLGSRDSQGDIHATSVICAPIRQGRNVVGLIHVYSTDSERTPDPDDLEFTLAVADNVALALKNLGRQQELSESQTLLKNEVDQLRQRLGAEVEIIGASPAMEKLQGQIAQAAPSRSTVLIYGESGVGKELVARAVHYASSRHNGPFKCLNCAALSESLLESELFGHEKGAFTGATDRKMGKFEAADKGTLMLDEIGEMSLSIQAKFLRVLEGHPFERIGGSRPITVDVRVIAATNRDLEKEVSRKNFRRDLYFRLHVIEIVVPPLRRRPQDIVELANHFLKRFNEETGKKIRGFSPNAFKRMQQYRWPGNVRELKNVVERAVVLARGEYIDAEDLTLSNLATSTDSGELAVANSSQYEPISLEEVEKRHITVTLEANEWNKSRSAAILGIERSTLDRKIRRYRIRRPGE